MRTLIKNTLLASMTAALLVSAGAAQAKVKEIKFHVVQTSFENLVYMEMKHDGNQWNWASQSKNFNTRIKVYFKASGGGGHTAKLWLTDTNAGLWALPVGYATNEHEELTTVGVGKAILSPFQGKAKALCDVFGGPEKVTRQMDVNAKMTVDPAVGNGSASKNGDFPIRVICQPKPNAPAPVELKVTQLKLYTVPAKPVCGKPVTLVTDVWTNKPGKVDFFLTRADGPKQGASVTTTKFVKGQGYVNRWTKTYTHKTSVDLAYQVVMKKQAMASNWAQMKLNCGAGADIPKAKKLKN